MAKSITQVETKSDTPTDSSDKPTADSIVAEFKASWDYTSGSYHKKWREAWKQANNERIKYGYKGISDTFVPLTFSIIQAAKANLIGGRPKITYLPTNDEQKGDTKTLDAYMDYDWDKGGWQGIIDPWTEDDLTFGTSPVHVYWHSGLDVTTGDVIPVKDFWIDPSVKSLEQAEADNLPCGYRYLTTKAVLKARMVVNEKYDDKQGDSKGNERHIPLYDHAAIDRATADAPKDMARNDIEKDMYSGSTYGKDARDHQVEVIVRYTNDRKIEVINRKEIILDEENKLGMLPFAMQTIFKPNSLFYGRGYPEILKQRQEELNDLENQDTDSLSYHLDQMFRYDPVLAGTIEKLKTGPGVGIPAKDGQIEYFTKPSYDPKAHEKRTDIKTDMREAVGAGEVLQAGGDPTKKTATEINAEQLNAGKRFDVQLQSLENGGFKRLGVLRFKLTQLYADKKCLVRVVGNKGVRFEKFLKDEFQGDYEPRTQLDASAKTEQAKLAQQQDQMYAEMIQNPLVNQLELTKYTLRKRWSLEDDEVDLLMSNPGQPGETQPTDGIAAPEAAMGAAPGGPMPIPAPGALPGGPVPPPAAPAPDPNTPPMDASGLTPDLKVKLYQAALTGGDMSLVEQLTVDFGYQSVPEQTPTSVAAKQHAIAQDKVNTAMKLQDSQHKAEQAQIDRQLQAEQAGQPVAK
jgi:hypothetical protein